MSMRYRIILGGVLLSLGCVLAVSAATNAIHTATQARATASVAPQPAVPEAQAGLRVTRDPETGEFTPLNLTNLGMTLSSDEEKSLDTSGDGLVQVQHADGSVSIDLQGTFQSMAVVRRDAQGHVRFYCVNSPDGAHGVLAPGASHQPAPVEE